MTDEVVSFPAWPEAAGHLFAFLPGDHRSGQDRPLWPPTVPGEIAATAPPICTPRGS
jgi:hypothetical protein